MDASSPDHPEAAVTPMMAQYLDIKRGAGDALLFYRMGDFYELFFDDAVKAAAALDITLTKRGRHAGDDIPMCGVPVHSHETYLARLIRKGFNVAVCEQTEDPAEAKKRGSKSVVRREIVRLITPGTLTEDTLLEAAANNYLAALAVLRGGEEAALAYVDVSTGELGVRAVTADDARLHAAALAPAELVIADSDDVPAPWRAVIEELTRTAAPARQPASAFDSTASERRICEAFSVAALDGFGAFTRGEVAALGALLSYVSLTQVGRIPALSPPRRAGDGGAMLIDQATRVSLEILESQSGGRAGSLRDAVDRTRTSPGARLLAARLAAPLTDADAINRRLDAVAAFADDARLTEDVRGALKTAPDIARAVSRLSLGRGGPRDLCAVRDGLGVARDIARILSGASRLAPPPADLEAATAALEARGAGGLADLMTLLGEALTAETPLLARDGGFIAKGFDPGLDKVRTLRDESRRVIAGLESGYREATGLKNLKIRHNNVLGYFVETPPGVADTLMSAPHDETFIHRQTLASAVRFTTGELAELDSKISRARDEALARELEIFERLTGDVLGRSADIGAAARALAEIDVAAAGAVLAATDDYVRPEVDDSGAFDIRAGRHPVVEQAAARTGAARFVPNDCNLAHAGAAALWLVTGPNMAGKSTFLRQNALIAILAQAGMYVPAESAHIGVADRVFSRVGASDDLARGRSTFMVEMVETAAILNQATERSIVVLDEIGRGTSTFDGLSIAWAAVEHLHDQNRCRALFATHYHELTALEASLPRLANVSMRVREWKGDVVFLHEVGAGAADRSYGVAVARLAGLPPSVVRRANAVLKMLESSGAGGNALVELPLFAGLAADRHAEEEPETDGLHEAVGALDPDAMTPREALDALYTLRKLAAGDE